MGTMRQTCIKLYALFVVAVMAITVGVFIFHIVGDVGQEIENAKVAFGKFENAVINEVKQTYLSDETGRNKLKKVADLLEIKGFVVQLSPSVGTVFSYPKDSSLFSIVNGNVLVRESSRFLKVFKTEAYVTVENEGRDVHITMLRSVLPSNMLFIRSRTVFFIMLFLILLTGFVIVLLQMKTSEKVERVYTSFKDGGASSVSEKTSFEDENPFRTSSAKVESKDIFSNTDDVAEDVEISSSKRSAFADAKDNSGLEVGDTDFKNEETPATFERNEMDKGDGAESSKEDANKESEGAPYGLYSPSTGLGWKTYLPERLSAELGRASSTDQDLSFVIIKIFDVDRSTIDAKQLADIVLEYFRFNDMVFEYSDSEALGFAGILQDAYIDDAIRICTILFSKLQNEIYLTGQRPTIKIGITTRAFRLVEADTMLKEAEAALYKAIQNENESIIGFKPSADKYRKLNKV